MRINFEKLFGPLTSHQYISRVKLFLLFAFPLSYCYARFSNRNNPPAPILVNRLPPLPDDEVLHNFLEQYSILKPYWDDEKKRAELTWEQRSELDMLKSLYWRAVHEDFHLREYSPSRFSFFMPRSNELDKVAYMRATVKLDPECSFYSATEQSQRD